MLSIRARIFAIVSIIVLFIVGISLILIVMSKKNTQPAPVDTNNIVSQDNFTEQGAALSGNNNVAPVPVGIQVQPQSTEQIERNAVKQLAKIFIERYGSYSTDSNFQNIKDVQSLVMPALWAKISTKIGSKLDAQNFVGVTTIAVSAVVDEMQSDSATVSIMATQTEDKNGARSTVQKNVTVYLVKSGSNWLVDKFEWK